MDEELRRRLLEAWRGEVVAGGVYEELARRQDDPARAQVLRRMSEAESGHRRRLEARMREVGVTVPAESSVRLSWWERLQIRIAPLERILAAREAAEQSEVQYRYRRPTGDEQTDRLLGDIRRDEGAHLREVRDLRAGRPVDDPQAPVRARLERLQARETWHQTGTGWISGAIYGANDGLAAVFGIVSGVSGATGGSHFVLLAGLAGALASALSMATGAFLAERSEAEVAEANLAQERREIAEHPEEEREELSLYYQLKGLTPGQADQFASTIARKPEAFVQELAQEELHVQPGAGGNPTEAAIAAGLSTGIGALVPVLPFFWMSGTPAVLAAAVVSIVAHFLVGAAKSLVTLRSWWAAGLEMTLAGIIVGAVTYAAGVLFQVG